MSPSIAGRVQGRAAVSHSPPPGTASYDPPPTCWL